MTALLTLLLLGAAPAPLPVEVMTDARLALLQRADAVRHLRLLDEELTDLRLVRTTTEVFGESVSRAGPLLGVGLLPALAVGFVVGRGGSIGNPQFLALIIGVPIGVAVLATVVYAIGSVVDYFFVRGPERAARLTQLETYRPRVQHAAEHNPP